MLRGAVVVLALTMGSGPAAAQGPAGDAAQGASRPVAVADPGLAGLGAEERSPAAEARRTVLDELEGLRGEIAMLKALKQAQEALFAWNGLRRRSGEKPAALDGALCGRVPAWCGALPASFGRAAGKGSE